MNLENIFPNKAQFDQIIENLEDIAQAIGAQGADHTWERIQTNIRLGLGASLYPVGTQFIVPHSVFGEMIWDVVGHDQVTSAEGRAHTMTLLAHSCISNVVFDAPEAAFYAASALPAGTYHFRVVSQPWYAGDVGVTFQFTLANAVPAGGQIMINLTYNATMAGKTVSTYSSRTATSAMESATISVGSAGTDLGNLDSGDNNNHIQRICFGSNNYKESAIRQFLNSDAAAGAVWNPQVKTDRPPSWNPSLAGFKRGLPAYFLDAVGKAVVKCSTNSIYEAPDSSTTTGGTYEVNDDFWLASRMEVYGSSDIADGSVTMTRFVGASNADRIKLLNGAARYWWLRTPHSGSAGHVRGVNTDGSLNYISANNSFGCVPACIIA